MVQFSRVQSLRFRISLALAALMSVVLLAVSLSLWFVLAPQIEGSFRARLDDVLRARVDDITSLVEKIDAQLVVFSSYRAAKLPATVTLPAPQFSKEIVAAAAFPPSGVSPGANGTVIDLRDRAYYKAILAGADFAASPAVLSRSDGTPTVVFARPRKAEGGTIEEITLVTLSLKALSEKIAGVKYGKAGFAWVLDQEGTIIAHPNPDFSMKNLKDIEGGEAVLAAFQDGQMAEATAPLFGQPTLFTHFSRIPHPAGWTVAYSVPESEVSESMQGLVGLLVGVLAIGLVLALLFGLIISRSLAKPVIQAQKSFEELAKGEADLTRQLPVVRRDEMGVMVGHFNQFLEMLRSMVIQIHESRQSIRDVLDQLEQSSRENTAIATAIGAEVAEVNRQTEVQTRSASQSSAAAEEIAANIQSLDQVIGNQAAAVTQASASIEEMARNIEAVFESTNRLSAEFVALSEAAESGRKARVSSSELIHAMVSRSVSLHEANEVISQIASQTNLLAMNAAIEAAHAGGAGRGFAVVADEIRKLAESSTQQSKGIADDIREVESSIRNLVSSSEVLGQVLDGVESKIQTTKTLVRQVHDAMAEQQIGSSQMLDALRSLTSLTETVRQGSSEMRLGNSTLMQETQSVQAAAIQIRNTIDGVGLQTGRLTDAATSVSQLVEKSAHSLEVLESTIGRFKV